jgi:hypothetical protein
VTASVQPPWTGPERCPEPGAIQSRQRLPRNQPGVCQAPARQQLRPSSTTDGNRDRRPAAIPHTARARDVNGRYRGSRETGQYTGQRAIRGGRASLR